ncbi:hypothetical protein A165_15150 [Vibrio tasmaniensis ZS-17]|uniref:TetR/AcrR family transcriptional regulator n=1 Tax=Vibrio tasmaniensis TaxID=212663 RepID=UPI0002ED2AD0|nr:TetR/AcrR family transcriptional regulator [Vibrio tasmaniensis]OED62880.1 hypothetical protein A165_15150 [Vibrio tasmaniensis ZS-17]
MKRKNQVEFSKRVICDAFFKLLSKYPYEKITVSLITTEAGVARNTFYRNFESIEGILIYKLDSVMDEAIKLMNNIENPTMRDLITWRVQMTHDYPYLVHLSAQPFLIKMFEKFTTENSSRVLKLIHSKEDKANPLKVLYHQAGIQAVIRQWVVSGQEVPVSDVVDLIMMQLPVNERT